MLNKEMNIRIEYKYDVGADLEVFKRVRVWLREEGGKVCISSLYSHEMNSNKEN